MTTWLRLLAAELPLLRDLPDFAERPLPRVGVALGSSIPGWVLRAAAAIATGGLLAVAMQRTAVYPAFGWTIVSIVTAVMAIWPATPVAHAAVVAAGFLIALDGHGPFDPVVFALIPLGYAAVRLAWWAERVTLAARVELAAFVPGLGRGCAVVGGTLALGSLAFVLVGRPSAIAVLAGGAGLVALGAFLLVARPVRPTSGRMDR